MDQGTRCYFAAVLLDHQSVVTSEKRPNPLLERENLINNDNQTLNK